MSYEKRSEVLIDVLEALQRSDIDYMLIGGFAVSQYQTCFSTDLILDERQERI